MNYTITSFNLSTLIGNTLEVTAEYYEEYGPSTAVLVALCCVAVITIIVKRRLLSSPRADAETFYHPNAPTDFTAMDLSKVKLEGNQQLFCRFKAYDIILKQWVDAHVIYCEDDHTHHFTANTDTGKHLGFAQVLKYEQLDSGEFGCPVHLAHMPSDAEYGSEESVDSKIELLGLYNKSDGRYKSIGYHLIQAVMQKFQDVDFRMELQAGYESHPFYYKLGFRSTDPEINQKIAAAVRKGTSTNHLHNQKLYLPEQGRLAWQHRIEAAPLPVM